MLKNERIKEWEIKFDAEQKIKEEELIKKFNDQLIKETQQSEKIIEFKREEIIEDKKEEILENELKKVH